MKIKIGCTVITLLLMGCASIPTDPTDRSMKSHHDDYIKCYDESQLFKSNKPGKIILSFSIAPDGSVQEPSVKDSLFNEPELEKCILGVLAKTHFEYMPTGGAKVNYPMLFKPE